MNIMDLLTNLNDFMWSYFLIGLVIVTGIYFTFSTKFVQFTYIKEMLRLISEKPKVGKDGEQKGVSAFQAFTISAASRVGTGTIAGVAIAIALGGPGSVFWMWVMALLEVPRLLQNLRLPKYIKCAIEKVFIVEAQHTIWKKVLVKNGWVYCSRLLFQ